MDQVLALFNMPGGTEWLVIAFVALVLFGKRLPDLARSFGRSIMEFKKGIREVRDDIDAQSEETSRFSSARPAESNRRLQPPYPASESKPIADQPMAASTRTESTTSPEPTSKP